MNRGACLHPADPSEFAIIVKLDPEDAMNATMGDKRTEYVGRKADPPAICVLRQNDFARTLIGLQVFL